MQLTCLYCGMTWKETELSEDCVLRCISCGDRNLKVSRIGNTDVFGYEGKRKRDAYLEGDE